jgi:hypothetical protein
MQRVLLLASALLIFSFASTSHAYPWMIRHGFAKCESCHTDPMGGETLTAFGRVMSQESLSTRWDQRDPSSASELLFGIPEPKELRIGGSFRMMDALYEFPYKGAPSNFEAFPMQLDVYGQATLFDRLKLGGSIGVSRITEGRAQGRAAQLTTGDKDKNLNLLSRTHWIGYDVTDDLMIRAGRLNLPFGIRMPEHTMWVRDNSATRTDRESDQQHGVAVDYSAGRWRGELMGVLGNYQISPDKYRERGYSLYAEYLIEPKLAVGVSSLITHAKADRYTNLPLTRQAHGITGRYSPVVPLVFLLEGDVLLQDGKGAGYVGMLQGDYEIIQGLHGMLTGQILDQGKPNGSGSSSGQGSPKLGGWVTLAWFFYTHFDLRVDFIANQDAPMELLSQVHWYF